LAVVAELLGRTEAETIQLILEYEPAPPFQSGTPERATQDVLATARMRLQPTRSAREKIIAEWALSHGR
jgi:cyclohexyl-isocyanide hydratase